MLGLAYSLENPAGLAEQLNEFAIDWIHLRPSIEERFKIGGVWGRVPILLRTRSSEGHQLASLQSSQLQQFDHGFS